MRKHAARAAQHLVADRVPVAVVDLLEVVEVEDHECDLTAVAVHPAQLDLECLAEELGAVEPGQGVEQGAPLEAAPAALGERRGGGGRSSGCEQRDPRGERERQRRRERSEQEAGRPRGRGEHDGGSEQDRRERRERNRRQGAAQCESQCGGEGEPVAAQPSVEHVVVIAARSDAERVARGHFTPFDQYSQDPPKKVLNP